MHAHASYLIAANRSPSFLSFYTIPLHNHTMTLWSLALTVLTGCLLGRYVYYFFAHLAAARKTELRYVFSPITPYTLYWQVAASLLRPVLIHFRWFRAIDWTCAWRDGNKIHAELGSCFIVVSPGLNVLCTDDPVTVRHVLRKWREFVKPDNVNGEYRVRSIRDES
jgi:hypothetical protein